MGEDFRIARFVSTSLLIAEEMILLAGVWLYRDLFHGINAMITLFCILSLVITHYIKDDAHMIYMLYDAVVVMVLSIALGVIYQNYYVALVAAIFYFVKCIYFRNKKFLFVIMLIDWGITIGGYFVSWNQKMVTFDLFLTFFVCLAFFLIWTLSCLIIDQINFMLQEAHEQEVSMDDLLTLVSNKVQEAEQANKAKGQFLANMSHEIRTPINAVLGMDTMILRDAKDEKIRKYALDIQSAGRSLLSVINDILDFSKIESGKMELVEVDYDFASMINDVVNMIRPKAQDKGLGFEVSVDANLPCRFQGDDVRIRQILVNLLTNAVKYTESGEVFLKVHGTCNDGIAQLTFEARDTGIGIKPEDLKKLSEEYVRIEESRNRNIEGTGLGMNIVIEFLKMMGSHIEVDSVYGEGSNFHFTIMQPVTNNEPIGDLEDRINNIAELEEYQALFCIPDVKMLVVDDNSLNRLVFTSLLRELQCQIDEADSGKQCLELVVENKYDLIFMDHMMPEMDGIETLHHMQRMDDYLNADTPVIILTANAISGAKEEYLAEGFVDYLSKPIDAEKLERMIGEYIADDRKQKISDVQVSKKTEAIEYPFIDGVDWEQALQKAKNEDVLQTFIENFSAMANGDFTILRDMFETLQAEKTADNFEQFRIKVHAMKSNAATIGANHVAGLAKYMEYSAKAEEMETIQNLMGLFEKEWMVLKQEIDEAFGFNVSEEVATNQVIAKEDLKKYLLILKEAMEELDLDRADAVIEELQEYYFENEEKQLIDELKMQVLNMDSDACDQTIDLLMPN